MLRPGSRLPLVHGLHDGDRVVPGDVAFYVSGRLRSLLQAERILLNIMQRMSGVATQTARYVKELEGLKTRVLDTRKTTPGMRVLDKMAVKLGGGENHRMGLFDMVILKDNHIDFAGGITAAVEQTKVYLEAKGKRIPIEVEVRSLDDVREVLRLDGVDRIMLDNMGPQQLAEVLPLIPRDIEAEISGGVTLETIRDLALASPLRPADFISVGRITHSAPSADFSMKMERG